jgi:hypothetical protein
MSKSKRLRGALAATLVGSALAGLLAVSGAGAQGGAGTAPPVQFFGSITINGAAAPVAGTTVTVSASNGETCVTAVNGGTAPNVIEASGGETIYGAQVQAQGAADDNACTFAAGDDVIFSVNGVAAATIDFVSTPPLQEVDLAITEATETPTSEPTDTPEPTGTGTPAPTGTTPATATPRPPDTGLGGSDEGANIGLILGLAVAAAAGLSASGYVLARRNSR